jgi:hypothetical protein
VEKPKDQYIKYVIEKVNSFQLLVPSSNWSFVFSSGDEFHRNPLATALLGIHYQHYGGTAAAGNSKIGIIAIR